MELIDVTTTCPDRATAERLARAAIEGRLAACAHLVALDSVYVWQGEVVAEPEVALTLRTTPARLDGVRRLVEREHPYEVPALIAVAVTSVLTPYSEWADAATADIP